MTELHSKIDELSQKYGVEAVIRAAEVILNKKVPLEYHRVLKPQEIEMTLNHIDASIADVIEKGQARETAYGQKIERLKEKTKLDTQLKLKEAEAFMNIQMDGKTQFVIVDGQKVVLSNDKVRDAYRYHYTQDERRQLSDVDAELNAIDVALAQAKDGWDTAKEASDLVKAKSYVQANLLKFLA